jgi:hypothetical protein
LDRARPVSTGRVEEQPRHPVAAAPKPARARRETPPSTGAVEWIEVPDPVATSTAFELPGPVHAFLDAWLEALARDDAAAHAALGFPTSEAEFRRSESARESFRLLAASVAPHSTPAQVFLRIRLSYAFQNGAGRFRTEDELRFILEPAASGLRFAGQWSE